MTERHRLVRVPASSANLGSGFDVFAAALTLHLELEVEETGEFAVAADGLDVPVDRSNLCIRAFESLHAADGMRFEIRSEIPLAAGLGSSAAAIVAGLYAADHLFELGHGKDELVNMATEIEGHPDNVAAAVHGGFVLCARGETGTTVTTLAPPEGVEALLVMPRGEQVPTEAARAALPDQVPFADAVSNVAAAAQLALGIERSDLGLIARGLEDRLHQPARTELYPRSMEVVANATRMGAIGASISGAGPTVLVWSFWQDTGKVSGALTDRYGEWAEIHRVPFTPQGADVPEL